MQLERAKKSVANNPDEMSGTRIHDIKEQTHLYLVF